MKLKFLIIIIATFVIYSILQKSNKIHSYTCLSCHNSKKYLEQKKRSFHSSVECTKCHIKEGFIYWVKLMLPTIFQSAKNYDGHYKVTLSSCTSYDCHQIDKINIIKKTRFFYDHRKHLELKFFGDRLLCQNCHIDVAHTYKYKSSKYICFLCHKISTPSNFKDCLYCHKELKNKKNHPVKNCDLCHIIEGSETKVTEEACLNCHETIKINYSNLDFLHTIHKKTGKIICFSCHSKTIHKK